MQLLQHRARLDPELLDQLVAPRAVDGERVGLAARAVEREHQLAAQPLAQRMLADERRRARRRARACRPSASSASARSSMQRQPQLVEPRDLGLRERLVGELGQRLAAPERERLAGAGAPGRRIARARLVDEPPRAREVELLRRRAGSR